MVVVPPTLKGRGQASTIFKDKTGSMLFLLRTIDNVACILHPKEPERSNVSVRKEFHDMFFQWGAFFRFDNGNAFARGTQEKVRPIRGGHKERLTVQGWQYHHRRNGYSQAE